ncbi:hypothetical protein [Ruegeria pomeroyi]|nr:hypothetical protein [Ruegeria pomeroyi]
MRTIAIGGHLLIQGTFVRKLPDGRISVKVDQQIYTGYPVQAAA